MHSLWVSQRRRKLWKWGALMAFFESVLVTLACAMQLILLHLSGQQLSKVRLRLRCVKWKWRPRKKCQSRRQLWIQLNHLSQQILKVSQRTFSDPQFYHFWRLLRKSRPRPNFQFQLIGETYKDRKSPQVFLP